jgi:PAS domain S-box-containing protein
MSGPEPDPVTVLHVDDEPGLCEVVADFLEHTHDWLEVEIATSASAGLDRVRQNSIDCVVSDYDMPEKNGLEFLKSIREENSELPFILYTGKGSEEIASEAISAGVDDYLQKEATTDQYAVLANRIKNVVDRERAESAAAAADERYHNLIDTAPAPIVLFDAEADIVYVNDAALEFLEVEDETELDDITMPELLVEDDQDTARERFKRLFERTESMPEMEYRIRALDGTVKKAIVATAPGIYRDRPVAQAIARQVVPIEERSE